LLSEDLITELGSLIRRLESKIRRDPGLLAEDPEYMTLNGIENAIIGLILLHVKLRSGK